MTGAYQPGETREPTARTLRWIMLTALALLVLWIAGGFLLIVFAGILVAITLRAPGDHLARATLLSQGKAAFVVALALLLLTGLTCWLLAPRLAVQVDQLWHAIPQSIDQLRARLSHYSWSETLFRQIDPGRLNLDSRSIVGRLFGAASSVLSFFGTLVVVCFVGLYLALDTGLYKRGFVRLFPPGYRVRATQILDELGRLLGWWLIAGMSRPMLQMGGRC